MNCRFQVYTCLVFSFIWTIQSRSQSAFPIHTFESYVHDEQTLLATPDPSDYVGNIAGSAAVTSTGAATFSVPIQVAPGSRGMQPDLAITYNSQSFNGLLGYGWSLNATSSISRGNDQYYVEAGVANANLEIDDAYYIDGQRLVHNGSLPYGQTGSKFLKRQHDGSLITVVSSNSYGPESFKVDYDGGRTVFYNSTGSANWHVSDENGNQVIVQYLIDRVEDCHGN